LSNIEKGVNLNLKVRPNSQCFALREFDASKNELRVNVRSPAQRGKANKELLKKFKKIFGSSVEIIKGKKSDKKIVLIGLEKEKVLLALKKIEK